MNDNYAIGKVAVWNRSDCCSDCISGSKVEILNSNGDVVDKKTIGDASSTMHIEFDFDGVVGKSVKITKSTSGPLSLAEVEVHDLPTPSNVLLQGVASQSNTDGGRVASLTIDGDTSGI